MNNRLAPLWPYALFAAAAFAAPLILSGNRYFAFIAGITLISVLWATGMNLLYGYTGLMPLMFAGIAGTAAYITVNMSSAGWSFWLAMPVGALAASLIGVALGLPSLRLRGFYFTLCSLVIQTVITLGFVYFVNLTNGDVGISQIPLPELPWGGRIGGTAYELLLAAIAVIGLIVLSRIVHSDFGRRLIALREDDGLAETLGVNVTRQKMLAFFIASLYAGIGGAFYAPYVGFISPRSFDVLLSLNIWLMVAFGGRGTLFGPVVGAMLLAPVPFLLADYYTIKDVVYGLLIIGVIMLMPAGVLGGFNRAPKPTMAPAPVAPPREPAPSAPLEPERAA